MPRAEQSTYPSGLSRTFPVGQDYVDAKTWGADLTLEMEAQPLGLSTRCLNPECALPVRLTPAAGRTPLYCSHHCRTRASRMRLRATQQLEVIETALATRSYGLPRDELRHRARILRWWLAHLAPTTAAEVGLDRGDE